MLFWLLFAKKSAEISLKLGGLEMRFVTAVAGITLSPQEQKEGQAVAWVCCATAAGPCQHV